MNQSIGKSGIQYPLWILVCLICLEFIMHFSVFNTPLVGFHVWRQTETQTVINNLANEDGSLFDPRVNNMAYEGRSLRKEFPLMQWIFARIQVITREEILTSRILSFLLGTGTLIFFFLWVKQLIQDSFIAALGAWCLGFSPAFYYYMVCPLPDNFAWMLAMAGLWIAGLGIRLKSNLYIACAAFVLGVSTLVKLPFVIFFVYPGIWMLRELFFSKKYPDFIARTLILTAGLIPALLWYIEVIPGWKGNGIVQGAFGKDFSFSEWMGYLIHHVVSVLPESIVNYGAVLFFIVGLVQIFRIQTDSVFKWPLICTGLGTIVYFLFELNMIKNVHDYYLFPLFPFIFFLVSFGLRQLWTSPKTGWRHIIIISLISLPILAFLRIQQRWDTSRNPGFTADFLVHRQALMHVIPEESLVVTGNDESTFIHLYYLDRYGWSFSGDNLKPGDLQNMVSSGAAYLVCDSEYLWDSSWLSSFIESEVWSSENLKVYKLKKHIQNENQ